MGETASESARLIRTFSLSAQHGARERLDTAEQAAQLLPPPSSSSSSPVFERISFSGKSLSVAAAEIFALFLSSLSPHLREADLSDVIAGRSTEEAIAVLSLLCESLSSHSFSLFALDLSHNAIGARGVDAVARALQQQRALQRVCFNNDGLQGQTVHAIVEALMLPYLHEEEEKAADASSSSSSTALAAASPASCSTAVSLLKTHRPTLIEHVEFARNLLEDEGPRALVPLVLASPHLRHFSLCSSRVSSNGGLDLCRALTSLSHLHHLNLGDASLGSEAGLILARDLLIPSKTRSLTHLLLGDIGINDKKETGAAIEAIVVALRRAAPRLSYLDLNSNDLNARLARSLSLALRKKRHLKTLILQGNAIHSHGAQAIVEALCERGIIEHLNLNETAIGARALPSLLKLVALPSSSLVTLNVNGNRFDCNALETLKESFEQAKIDLGTLSDNEDEEDEEDEDEDDDAIDEAEHEEDEADEHEHPDNSVDALAEELSKI